MAHHTIVSRFFTIPAKASGTEVPNMLGRGGPPDINTGFINQVIVKAVSGGGSKIERVEIRYDRGNPDEHRLVYLLLDEEYPVVDSHVEGPFSLLSTEETGSDMHLYVQPEADGVLQVRVDIEMLGVRGS